MRDTLRKKRAITTEAYQLMIREGILTKEDKVELIHGEIIDKMIPIGSKHSSIVDKLTTLLTIGISSKRIVRVQSSIDLTLTSQPEPDLTILKYKDDYYYESHPKPEDVVLIIEVADSSIAFDREVKMPLYAEAKIPEFWIIDIENEVVEVYKKPQEDRYRLREIFRGSDIIQIADLNISIEINSIFPNK